MHDRSEVRTTMERLLQLADAPVRSVWSGPEGARLHHLEAGSGPAVILLHGGTGGGANWFRVIGPLARRFRVLAPDLPGFGFSDPVKPRAPLSRLAAERLLHWLELQPLSDALVAGTSFGGLTALRLAQQSPAVTRLLLLDSAGLGRSIHPLVRVATVPFISARLVRPSRRGTAAVFRHLLTSERSDMPEEHQTRLIDYLHATGRAAGTAYLSAMLRLFSGVSGQREVVGPEELRSLRQPVALVWGELDRLMPVEHARHAAALIPDATLRVVLRTGHSPNWERPDAVVTAIAELARRPAVALPDRTLH